jgi:hypothetical protein
MVILFSCHDGDAGLKWLITCAVSMNGLPHCQTVVSRYHSKSLVVNPELVVNVSLQRLFDRHKPVQIVRVIRCFLESGDTKNRDTEFGIEEAL